MNNKIAKQQLCLIQRNGVQIWIDAEKAKKLQTILANITDHKFIQFDGRTINTADCTGVYLPEDIENLRQQNNGMRQCQHGKWHSKNEQCNCVSIESQNRIKRREEAITACGRCSNGMILVGNTARYCECVQSVDN